MIYYTYISITISLPWAYSHVKGQWGYKGLGIESDETKQEETILLIPGAEVVHELLCVGLHAGIDVLLNLLCLLILLDHNIDGLKKNNQIRIFIDHSSINCFTPG